MVREAHDGVRVGLRQPPCRVVVAGVLQEQVQVQLTGQTRQCATGGYTRSPPGAIAQLGERLDRTQEVGGSSPPSSTSPEPLPPAGVSSSMVGRGLVAGLLAALVVGGAAEPAAAGGIGWKACGARLECARVAVPLDWRAPGGPTIALP